MTCPNCQRGELHQFQPTAPSAAKRAGVPLPEICTLCHQMYLGGKALDLPAPLREHAAKLADEAREVGKRVKAELQAALAKDPGVRIATYIEKTWSDGYIQGIFRALAFANTHGREGRIKRLRILWERLRSRFDPTRDTEDTEDTEDAEKDLREFEILLHLKAPDSGEMTTPGR